MKGELCFTCRKRFQRKHECHKCTECDQFYVKRDTHVCKPKHLAWKKMQKDISLSKGSLSGYFKMYSSINDLKQPYHFDLECFQGEKTDSLHEPYAAGLYNRFTNSVEVFYGGGNVVGDLLSRIFGIAYANKAPNENDVKIILSAYNGASYDFKFVFQYFIGKGYRPKFHLQSGNIIWMWFSFHARIEATVGNGIPEDDFTTVFTVTTFDLCRFTQKSLRECGRAYGLHVEKDYFPHKFITSEEDLYRLLDQRPADKFYFELPSGNEKSEWDSLQPKPWSVEKVCVEYLRKDVQVLNDLFMLQQKTFYDDMKGDITDFRTMCHKSYACWLVHATYNRCINVVQPTYEEKKYPIFLPSPAQWGRMEQAIYGGRVIAVVPRWRSSNYDDIINGNMKYGDIKDYLLMNDVCSLYPDAEVNNDYPIGEAREANQDELRVMFETRKLHFGFYKVTVHPNRNLVIPPIGKKKFASTNLMNHYDTETGLKWDVEGPYIGWYCHIDIETGWDHGYQFVPHEGFIYAASAPVFKEYVTKAVERKLRGAREGNPVMELEGKSDANGLYGKCIQKLILEHTDVVENEKQWNEFSGKYEITSLVDLPKGMIGLKGKATDIQKHINKPAQLGAYILAYSRRKMAFYFNLIDPFSKIGGKESLENCIFYTDTDSAVYLASAENQERLAPYSQNEVLGNFPRERTKGRVKEEFKIIDWIALGPKKYSYVGITESNKMFTVSKCKGLPKSDLKHSEFEMAFSDGEKEKILKTFDSIKKYGFIDFPQTFGLQSTQITREFGLATHQSRHYLADGKSVPHGHVLELEEYEEVIDYEEL